MSFKTNNEKSADQLLDSLKMPKPNCYMCQFFHPITQEPFSKGKCLCPVAQGIMMDEDGVRKAIGATENAPLFPVTTIFIDDEEVKSEVEIPSLIASEYGVAWGLVKWPSSFDPIYILFCLFFSEKDKKIDD